MGKLKDITWTPTLVKVEELKENELNPKILNEQGRKRLQKSLAKFGLAGTLICNTDKVIIDGHSRKKELLEAGITEVWASMPDRPLTDKEYREFNAIFDVAKAGDPDFQIMEDIFEDDFFEEWDLDRQLKIPGMAVDDGYEAPAEIATDIKRGDLFEIGQHRLLCGDSTDRDDVNRLLNGSKPNLMVTDPPYGVNYDPGWRDRALINKPNQTRALGKVSNDDQADWTPAWDLFPGSIAYVWHGGLHTHTVLASLQAAGFQVRSQIIWAKKNLVIGRGHYHWQHEPCWYVVRKGSTANWAGDRKQSTLWQIENMHRTQGNVDDGKTFHSTQKPVECMARPIRNNTFERESVYDPFTGSGTTMVAAHQLNRAAYCMELDPQYCQMIIDRMAKLEPGIVIRKNSEIWERTSELSK